MLIVKIVFVFFNNCVITVSQMTVVVAHDALIRFEGHSIHDYI